MRIAAGDLERAAQDAYPSVSTDVSSLGRSGGSKAAETVASATVAEAPLHGQTAMPSIGPTGDSSTSSVLGFLGTELIERMVKLESVADTGTSLRTIAPSPGASEPVAHIEPVAYEDEYLFEGDLPAVDIAQPYASQPFGRRELRAELMYYDNDDDRLGADSERGARVYWSRETESWGVMDLDIRYANIDSSFVGRETASDEAVVTFRQSAIPVSSTALLDTAAGHQRLRSSSLLHGGYRYRLPTSSLRGLSGELAQSNSSRIRFATGDVGAYRGVRIPQFTETGGRLTALAYEQSANEQLDLGAELVNLRGDTRIRDHTSMLLGARYNAADNSQEHAARLLADDDGNMGLWIDSRHELGSSSTFRYGAFSIDPELVWSSLPIANDQMGAYLRASTGNARYSLSGGYDYLETGIGSGSPVSTTSHAAFVSGSFRVRRALSLGFNAGLTNRNFDSATGDEQVISRINAFATIASRLGSTRLEVFSYDLDSDSPANQQARTGAAASLTWRMPQKIRLTTEFRVEQNEGQIGDSRRTELAALFNYDLFNNLSLGLNSRIYQTHGDSSAQDGGLSLSAQAGWTFHPNWHVSLSVNRNRTDFRNTGSNFFGIDSAVGESSVWLTVRYERQSGRPYPILGRAHEGMSGSGTISGQVFFDLNRDSIRQPSEEVAAGVVVLLDGRYETRTDEQGWYSFAPVPTGAHEVSVLLEELPLPWGLDDEAPRRVAAQLREVSTVDFPLVVIE
jgi:hypothetical protein